MRRRIEPRFGPGSGWHKPGIQTPGSDVDRKEMLAAAIQCTVFQLRRLGQRLPPGELLAGTHHRTGLLVCLDRYTAPKWYACLFEAEDMRKELARLMHAELERENDGVRLYRGVEPDGHQLHRQSWLCTPSVARGMEILREMARTQPRAPG